MSSRAALVLVALLSVGGVMSGCFERAPLEGYFRCETDEACGGDRVCFDGVCCRPRGEPLCLGYVFEDGSCADGGVAQTYYPDLDQDGFGDTEGARLFCAEPVSGNVVLTGGDCNDNPEAGGPLAVPGRSGDACDGIDNDCDGEFDEDQERTTFYFDADGDGHGDLAAPRLSCAAPSGYVTNSDDCAPQDVSRYPGAPEQCNGVSDDCDAEVDEEVVGTGAACDANAQGLCARGQRACVQGAWTCAPGTPSPDVCDELDNDCDGVADETPDCGGPTNLLLGAGVLWKAQNLGYTENQGITGQCMKDHAGSFNETFASPQWSGSGVQSHLLWVETTGTPWDLTRPNTRLRLKFSYLQRFGSSPYWMNYSQPLVFLCGVSNAQHIRYVHKDAALANATLLVGTQGTVETVIPVLGGSDGKDGTWVKGIDSSLDLTAVRRMEILLTPASTTGTPTFDITLQSVAFESGP